MSGALSSRVLGLTAVVTWAVLVVAALGPAPATGRAAEPHERRVLTASADTWVGMSEDAFFDERSPDDAEARRGAEPRLVTGSHGEYRGLSLAFVGFDRPTPPLEGRVVSASLEMLVLSSYGGPLPQLVPETQVYEVLEPWDEATLDAYNAPRLHMLDQYVGSLDFAYAVPGQWAAWDVTGAVRRAQASGDWHGFWLVTGGKQWLSQFASRETLDAPRLTIELVPQAAAALYLPCVSVGGRREAGATATAAAPTPTREVPVSRPELPPADEPGSPRLLLGVRDSELDYGDVPQIASAWHNTTDDPVTVILPVEATTYAWRMPMYVWSVTRRDGPPPRERYQARCSCFEALTPDDFATLAPGEQVGATGAGKADALLGPDGHFSFAEPGSYELRLVYFLDRLGGVSPPDVAEQWSRARDMTVVSGAVSVTVGAPPEPYASLLDASRRVAEGMTSGEVESAMGPADQQIDESFIPYRTYLIYYLAAPRDGEPDELISPQTDYSYGAYWRPRFVVTLGGEGDKLVRAASLLP